MSMTPAQRERHAARIAARIIPLIPRDESALSVTGRTLAKAARANIRDIQQAIAYLRTHPAPGSLPLIAGADGYRYSLDRGKNAAYQAMTKKRILAWLDAVHNVLRLFLDSTGVNPVTRAAVMKSCERLIEDLRDVPITVNGNGAHNGKPTPPARFRS